VRYPLPVRLSAHVEAAPLALVRGCTLTHAPFIPTLTWVQVERGASHLRAKSSGSLDLSHFLPYGALVLGLCGQREREGGRRLLIADRSLDGAGGALD